MKNIFVGTKKGAFLFLLHCDLFGATHIQRHRHTAQHNIGSQQSTTQRLLLLRHSHSMASSILFIDASSPSSAARLLHLRHPHAAVPLHRFVGPLRVGPTQFPTFSRFSLHSSASSPPPSPLGMFLSPIQSFTFYAIFLSLGYLGPCQKTIFCFGL